MLKFANNQVLRNLNIIELSKIAQIAEVASEGEAELGSDSIAPCTIIQSSERCL